MNKFESIVRLLLMEQTQVEAEYIERRERADKRLKEFEVDNERVLIQKMIVLLGGIGESYDAWDLLKEPKSVYAYDLAMEKIWEQEGLTHLRERLTSIALLLKQVRTYMKTYGDDDDALSSAESH